MTVGSGVGLEADPGEDPEPVQQGLQAAHQILPDHVHFHHGRTCPCRDKALGLEDAAKVGGHDRAEPRRAGRELHVHPGQGLHRSMKSASALPYSRMRLPSSSLLWVAKSRTFRCTSGKTVSSARSPRRTQPGSP